MKKRRNGDCKGCRARLPNSGEPGWTEDSSWIEKDWGMLGRRKNWGEGEDNYRGL